MSSLRFAQRRHLDRDDVEPVVEVLAEMPGLDHRRQVAIGRRDQPHVDPQRSRAAQALELVLLQDAQDLRLRARAHVADLVEEQGAAVRLLEAADPLFVSAGERTLFVTEQFGLEQVLLQRRAIHFHEVPRRAQRVVMDGAGNQLLTSAGFAANQHGRVALRHFLDDVEHALQGRAGADDLVEFVDVRLRATEVLELVLEAAHLERLLDLDLHLLDLEWLLHVVEGADLHRLDCGVHRSERGHQDHGGRRMHRARRPQHVHAVAAAHLQIAQHHIEVAVVQLLYGKVAVRGLVDLVSGFREPAHQSAPQRVVVVSN